MTYQERQRMERANTIAVGLRMGWIKINPPTPEIVLFAGNNKRNRKPLRFTKSYADLMKCRAAKRAENIAKGLRWDGKPLTRKRPVKRSLKGLAGKDYHRNYMRLWRAEKAKTNE